MSGKVFRKPISRVGRLQSARFASLIAGPPKNVVTTILYTR